MPKLELIIALSALFLWLLHHGLEYVGALDRFSKVQVGVFYLINAGIMLVFILLLLLFA